VYKDEGVWPEYLGSYHMIHKIDDEIFAVGVLDYSQEVLSSVYLYYNPKYEFLSPGTLAALREIEYIRRVQEVFDPKFKYYYMGLYFQDCQKSVYKGSFKPSQVLCPHTCNYVYLTDEVREKINKEKFPKLCEDKALIKEMNLTPQ
jgi:arginine-tRNA-protein transferase